jgi:hypothetical protein
MLVRDRAYEITIEVGHTPAKAFMVHGKALAGVQAPLDVAEKANQRGR